MKKIGAYYLSINRSYFLFFIAGILSGLMLYFFAEDNYEKKLFQALADDVRKPADVDDSTLLMNSLHLVHDVIKSRPQFFNNVGGVKASVIQPITVDLMTGQGACGSYALVMARLLKQLDVDVRMVQMKVGEVFGGHNIIEAKYKDGWVVFDPLYDLYFKRPDGKMASFSDVQHNWNYYTNQLPVDYDHAYRYEDVRYTNWSKIPVLMPAIKQVLNLFMGKEKADTFSLRIVTLRKFQVFFIVTLFFEALLIIYIAFYQHKKKRAYSKKLSSETIPHTEESKINVVVINPSKMKIPSGHQ